MNELKIRKSTIEIVILCMSFYEFTGFPHALFLIFKYSTIAWLIMTHIKECKWMKAIVLCVFLYSGVTFVATLLHQNLVNRQVASFIYIMHILSIFLTTNAFVRSRGIEEFVKILAKILMVLVLITDIPMLFVNYNFSSPSESYIIGNKFTVSYLHCFATAILFCVNVNKNNGRSYKKSRILFCLYSILICIRVTCTTGMLICILMGMLILLPVPFKTKKIMSSPKFIILITAVINMLVFGSASLLTNEYVENFIYNVLGKGGTWIGRLNIYKIIFGVIQDYPLIGHGYYSNIIKDILGFGNPQNGVLKILLDSGIIGLIGYAFLAYESLKQSDDSLKARWPLIVFVYCMIAAAIPEINLTDYLMFLTMAIIFAGEQERKIAKENYF